MSQTEVITNLHWDVSSEVVRGLLKTRIEQCETKAQVFIEQAEAQAELTEKLRKKGVAEDAPIAKHSGDQSENLRSKASTYTERAKMYKFLHDHVVKDGTYRLDRNDLQFLGIISRDAMY